MSSKDIEKYVDKHSVPAVYALEQFFITDHHHTALALMESNADSQDVVVNVTDVLPWAEDEAHVWQWMIKANLVRCTKLATCRAPHRVHRDRLGSMMIRATIQSILSRFQLCSAEW